MTSEADLKHCIHKDGGPIMTRKDKKKGQTSNNNTRLSTNVFSRNIGSMPRFLAMRITFWVFLKRTLVSLPGIGFDRFVTAILASKDR